MNLIGFLVVILVDAHLAGVDSSAGFTGAVVGKGAPRGRGLDVNESSLGARGFNSSSPGRISIILPQVGKNPVCEPRARLPVRPGGLCRRRLDGSLSVSY